MAKVSVIVPVYNVGNYIKELIESVLRQTFKDFELILVDDGSCDNSGDICDEFSKKDDRVIVIHTENGGTGAARNVGVSKSTGGIIAFVDGDDAIHPKYLELLYDAYIKYDVKIAGCEYIEGEKIPEYFNDLTLECDFNVSKTDDDYISYFFRNGSGHGGGVTMTLVDREVVLKSPFPENKISEDLPVVIQYFINAKSMALTNAKLYFYRKNPNSAGRKPFDISKIDTVEMAGEAIKHLAQEGGYNKSLTVWFGRFNGYAVDRYKKSLNELHNKEAAKKVKNITKEVYKKYGKYANLDKRDKLMLIDTFAPTVGKIYWTGYGVFNKIKKTFFIKANKT